MSKRIKLYHGSPHRLDEIRPTVATGKGEASAREHAIYLANNPEEARLYALTRPRNNKRKGWAILDNKVHYVKGDPINKQGYVYEHEFDDYAAPPELDPGIGYRVYGAYKPAKRKRVRLRGIENQFVEHPDKASYKAKVKEWLATREKTAATNMYHGSNAKFDRFEPKRHKLSGDQPVVFGTPLRAMAIAGMGRRWNDDDFEQATYNDEDLLHMRELKPGALERIYKGTRGYLYEVDPESFEHGGDAYMPTEFISKSSPKILKRTEVDAYEAMLNEERAGRLKIHRMHKKAALKSQEDIFQALKKRIPSGAHHVSGGLPDARGLSDVDIYLPRKKFTGLERKFPQGTSVTEQGDDYTIYSIPGFKREVNVYATNNPAKRESIDHRRTMMALANKYPQTERRAFAIKQKGKGSEPAWAEVLGLQGDPYEVMRDTDRVMRHASTMKLASKRFRHRAGLIIRDDQGRILVSEATPERVAKGISRVSLPGGGVHDDENETRVPTRREIIRAARKEALEELGMRIRNPRVLGSHSGELEDWWKDQQEKKRGVRFDGAAEHFVLASPGRKDMSLYNVEGDAFPGKYRDMAHLTPLMEQDANRNSAFAQFNKKQLELIKGLGKTASFRDRIRSIEIPPEFGKITDRYYQTRGQGELINYGNNRYTDYRNPKLKRTQRMEHMYGTKTAQKGVATKTDPAAWARAKAQARAKMGGKHSARAMQLATQIYKKNGGGYSGAKPSSGTNKLKKWTKQKWQWSGKDTPGPGGTGVYLPKRSSEQLKSTRTGRDKLRAASAAKRAATNSGRQFSSHGLHVGKKRSDVR